jgi:hypothetical protein
VAGLRVGPVVPPGPAVGGPTRAPAAPGRRTYALIAAEWQAAGPADQWLTRLREAAFMGQTL